MKEPSRFRSEDFRFFVSDKAGSVSARMFEPDFPRAVVTLAHSAGTDMHQPFLLRICEEFAEHNIATIRFNFPYREHGRKMPDRYPVAATAVMGAIDEAIARFPNVPVFCAGKSFGGRMSSMTLSDHPRIEVKGLIFFGFPLHPPDNPSIERAKHLEKSGIPMLFFQGTKDKLAYIDLIEAECAKLSKATLVKLEGVDHSMTKGKQSGADALVQRSAHWINQVITNFGDSAGHLI
jgi:predicted alpha/beta-hydrolase family hydrolase